MSINVVRNSKVPLYRQIAEQIRSQIVEGEVTPDSILPSARLLAAELGVSMFAVHRAYVELAKMGLVESKERVGTRVVGRIAISVESGPVASLPNTGPTISFERLSRSAGIRSMASVSGDPELFQADSFLAEIGTQRNVSPWNFDYSSPAGSPQLLREIARLLTRRGLVTNESSLAIITGCLGGIATLLDLTTNLGDTILVQSPGRLWLREVARLKRLSVVPVAVAGEGLDMDHLADMMRRHKPKVLVLSPDFGYCTGHSMPLDQREGVLRLARATGVLVVEDGGVSALRYEGSAQPSLATLDGPNVVHVGSFSYSLCPGVGVGYIRLPPRLRTPFVTASEALGHHIPPILQLGLTQFLEGGGQEAHLRRTLPKYQARRNALLDALDAFMPRTATWTRPSGGFASWITLPRGYNSSSLYSEAIRVGVAFAPGRLFVPTSDPENHLRLSFSLLEPEVIRESVRTIAKLIGGGEKPPPTEPRLPTLIDAR